MKAPLRLLVVAIVAYGAPLFAQAKAAAAKAGDYEIRLANGGVLQVFYKGECVSLGSYFSIWGPGYKGSVVSVGGAWRKGKVAKSDNGRTLTLTADLPKASVKFGASVSEDGVHTKLWLKLAEDAVVGPSEYPAFMVPSKLVKRAMVEMLNVAGLVVGSKVVPDEPKRGGLLGRGDEMRIKTAKGIIVISTTSPNGLYPFDARHKQYHGRQGIWAFSACGLPAGYEGTFEFELKMAQPEPPRPAGSACFERDIALAEIATAPNPTKREQFAADELGNYIYRICGKRVERIERTDAPQGVIAVGQLAVKAGLISKAECDAVGRDGYVVRVAKGRAGICGGYDIGTIYGAYALLERMGCKFYAPSCEVVPQTQRLVVPDCELSAKPFFEFRNLVRDLKLGNTPADDIGNPREFGEPGGVVHAAAYLAPFDKLCDVHPEYFALQRDGARLRRDPQGRPINVHICLTNPEARLYCSMRLVQWMEKQPDRKFFGCSQGDGFAWCQCADCKAMDQVPGRVTTDRLIDYVNAVVKRAGRLSPDKRVLTLAYTAATSPPPVQTLPAFNVRVQFCPYPGRVWCQSHDLTCEKNKAGLADIKGWIAKCPNNMYVFDYPRGYKIYYEPFGSFYAMKRKLQFYAANGIRGMFYCGVPTNFRDLFIWVQSHMLWNPKVDVEALIDEFMQAYYGAAAPVMREYFNFMHSEVDRRHVHQMCEGANPGLVTAEYSRKALAMFAKMEAATAKDRISRYRVLREKVFVLFADVNERNLVNGKIADSEDAFARRLAEFCKLARMMRIRVVGRREAGDVPAWLWHIARLRVKSRPWYAAPVIARLIDKPEYTLRSERQRYSQTPVAGGIRINLDAFCGGKGPSEYAYQCPKRTAVWIYAKDSKWPQMWAKFGLDNAPRGRARLVLEAQDDDKPGAVRVRIAVNGKPVFAGPNPFKEKDWSRAEFDIPAGVLKAGENELRISSLEPTGQRDSKWFMVSECKLLLK